MCLGGTARFFEKFVIGIQNGTFVPNSCIPCAGSIYCVCLAVYIRSVLIRWHLKTTKTTSDTFLAGNLMIFATRFVLCAFRSSICAFCASIINTLAFSPVSIIATLAESTGNIFHSTENILWMHFSIYVVGSKTFTGTFWMSLSQVRAWRSPFCIVGGITLSNLIASFFHSQPWQFRTLSATFPLRLWIIPINEIGLCPCCLPERLRNSVRYLNVRFWFVSFSLALP